MTQKYNNTYNHLYDVQLGRGPNILLQDPGDKTIQVYTVGNVRNPGATLRCRNVFHVDQVAQWRKTICIKKKKLKIYKCTLLGKLEIQVLL